MTGISSKLLRQISRNFNRYRYPECRVRVVENMGENLKVEFSGTIASFSCCFDENFVDYIYLLEDLSGQKFKIKEIKREFPDRFVVTYMKLKKEEGCK
jgi:hypothetical protein